MVLFWNRWISLRTEGGSRTDLIDRLQAHLQASGLKTKLTDEGNSLRRIHVRKKDAERAKALMEDFDKEH